MKTIQILLIAFVLSSSAYAFGDRERSALIGFGAGILVAHLADQAKNTHFNDTVAYSSRVVQPVKQVAYYDTHHKQYNHFANKHHKESKRFAKHTHKKACKKQQRKHHHRDNIVVVNRYNTHYHY